MLIIYHYGANYPQTWKLKMANIILSHIILEDQKHSALIGTSHSVSCGLHSSCWSGLQLYEGLAESGGPTSELIYVAVGRNPQFLTTWGSP